jgi:hypothetical protein
VAFGLYANDAGEYPAERNEALYKAFKEGLA